MSYKTWVTNEYDRWVDALKNCDLKRFRDDPTVKRMIGQPDLLEFATRVKLTEKQKALLIHIDNIGKEKPEMYMSGTAYRYAYYAQQIISKKPASMIEIGGGYGHFLVTLRALGWTGHYKCYDLPEVLDFQSWYRRKVAFTVGLEMKMVAPIIPDMVVSFYALCEFSDDVKQEYSDLVNGVKRGYIACNPHSGATDDLSYFKHKIQSYPGIEPGITIVEW